MNFKFLFCVSLLLSTGCTHSYKEIPAKSIEDICSPPSPTTFDQAGISLSFAQSTWKDFILGDISIESNPQIVTLTSQSVKDEQIRNYLGCLAIHRDGYNNEQVEYQNRFMDFMATNPSTSEFIEYRKLNPFPDSDIVSYSKNPKQFIWDLNIKNGTALFHPETGITISFYGDKSAVINSFMTDESPTGIIDKSIFSFSIAPSFEKSQTGTGKIGIPYGPFKGLDGNSYRVTAISFDSLSCNFQIRREFI